MYVCMYVYVSMYVSMYLCIYHHYIYIELLYRYPGILQGFC